MQAHSDELRVRQRATYILEQELEEAQQQGRQLEQGAQELQAQLADLQAAHYQQGQQEQQV